MILDPTIAPIDDDEPSECVECDGFGEYDCEPCWGKGYLDGECCVDCEGAGTIVCMSCDNYGRPDGSE